MRGSGILGGMAVDEQPTFRYHPDPLATGSAVESDAICDVCGESRGVVYDGPIYGRQAAICLVCIASGAAATALSVGDHPAEFTDVGQGVPPEVPQDVLDTIARRTPGFRSWQQEHWLYHCGDGAAFLGLAGYDVLSEHPDALDMLLHENDEYGWTAAGSEEYVRSLRRDGDATAYLFKCRRCSRHLAYSDTN
jgi:uncharacterized protein CbrC (UPF0167 family)